MFAIIVSGGWLMVPILLCSVIALVICIERWLTLKSEKIAPPGLLLQVWRWMKNDELTAERMQQVKQGSPLGQVLVAGLENARYGRDVMKESIEEAASHVVHEMEKYLNALGTVANVTPLLGLLGTVLGMITVFTDIVNHGTGDPTALAGGISTALVTTASGLSIAIPAMIMHRYFHRRIDEIVVSLEQESIKLVDALHHQRRLDVSELSEDASGKASARTKGAAKENGAKKTTRSTAKTPSAKKDNASGASSESAK